MFKKQKGYIGAIGDDLPSLIPLFLGIVLFFAVFITTYTNYTQSTNLYGTQNEALRIALILKEEPLIIDHNFFVHLCNKVDTSYNWTAFLVDINLSYEGNEAISLPALIDEYKDVGEDDMHDKDIISIFVDETLEETENDRYKPFVCGDFQEFLNIPHARINTPVINYMFPLTRQVGVNAIPVKLYVVIWD